MATFIVKKWSPLTETLFSLGTPSLDITKTSPGWVPAGTWRSMRPSTVFTYSQQTNHTIPSLNEDTNLQILDTVLDCTGSLFGSIWHPSCMLRGSKSLHCSIVLLHHENGKSYSQYNHHNNLTKRWKALRETTTCTFLGCRMQGICKWCKRRRYKMTFRNKLRSLWQDLQRGLNSSMEFLSCM